MSDNYDNVEDYDFEDLFDTDNVVPFPNKKTDAEVWDTTTDLLTKEIETFRKATDDAAAERVEQLMREGPLAFDLGKHELELPADAKVKDNEARRRLINALAKLYKAKVKEVRQLRDAAAAEWAREKTSVNGRPAARMIIEDYAFDEVAGKFIDRSSMLHLAVKSFEEEWNVNLMHVLKAAGSEFMLPLTVWFRRQPDALVVGGICRTPNAEEGAVTTVEIDGLPQRLLNAWRDPVPRIVATVEGEVGDADVEPWLDLGRYLLGVAGHDDTRMMPLLDWQAGMAAAPALKPGWAPYLSGDPGAGKNLFLLPLERAVSSQRISPLELGRPFDEYRLKRLCIINEARETTPGTITPHDVYGRLKELIDATTEWILVNQKYMPKRWVYDTTGMVLFTNQPNALPVDARERRLAYYRVEVTKRSAEYYAELVGWLKQGPAEGTHTGVPGWKLVVKWLVERWKGLSEDRKTAFQSDAPMTPEKVTMVAVAASSVKEMLGEAIAGNIANHPLYCIPDLVDPNQVRKYLRRMADAGEFGVDKGAHIPSNAMLANWLREFGGEQMHYDKVKRVHTQVLCADKDLRRLWAIRNAEKYRNLTPDQLRAKWQP